MSDPFSAPADPSSGIQWEGLLNSLLLITVKAQEFGVKTNFGEKDPIRADVAVLDGPNRGEHPDTLIFPTLLVSQLKQSIGGKVLGRLGQGQAKAGQKPPWLLLEATETDKQVGIAYLTGVAQQQVSQPAAGSPPF